MMKWLWMLCPPGLCRRSVRANLPNGTLPIARSKLPSAGPGVGEGLAGDVGVRVERRGDRGGDRLQLDAGDPGAAGREADEVARCRSPASRTRPPVKPSCCTPAQMAWTSAASV